MPISNDQLAEKILLAVKGYLDQTARKHNCVGFDCSACSLWGDRHLEALEEVRRVLEENI